MAATTDFPSARQYAIDIASELSRGIVGRQRARTLLVMAAEGQRLRWNLRKDHDGLNCALMLSGVASQLEMDFPPEMVADAMKRRARHV